MALRACAYPGCDVMFEPVRHQKYHDQRESWRLSNRKWAAANREKKNASQRRYEQSPHGHVMHYIASRESWLRRARARTVEQLAALRLEDNDA